MTVPELKSTVYLLPEIAWPIIKKNLAIAPSAVSSRKKLLDCYI